MLRPQNDTLRFRYVNAKKLQTDMYGIWWSMKKRCLNRNHPTYERYGARGITVCREWVDDFEAFLRDVGPRPGLEYSLERIDNNGNYEPGNTKWATRKEQANNRRSNRPLTFKGKTQNLRQWSEEYGLERSRLRRRLDAGWDIERALLTPGRRAA